MYTGVRSMETETVSQGSGICAALCIRRTLCRHVTIGTPMVIFCCLTVFWLFLTNGTLYQSSKILKTIGVQTVKGLPRLYKQCTNGVPIVKNSQNTVKKWPLVYESSHVHQDCTNRVPTVYQKQSKYRQNSKNDHWCTNRHRSTKTVPCSSVTIVYQSSTRT